MVKWKAHADQLAAQVTHPVSRWRPAVGAVPRHLFVPRWWERSGPAAFGVSAWTLCDGPADTEAWIRATYADRALVTRVGSLHADHATPDDQPTGLATARCTEPGITVRMLRLTRLTDDGNVLAVGVSSGYACAVLCEWSGHRQVSCLEPDEYLAKSAIDRLGTPDLYSALGLAVPGVEHDYADGPDGCRTAWMVHPDGSWARATGHGDDPPTVHQSGPRRLWDHVDDLRECWLRHGSLPVHGATATLSPDGTVQLSHAWWRAALPAAT